MSMNTLAPIIVLLAVGVAVYAIVRVVRAVRAGRGAIPGVRNDDPLAWLPVPPGATERRTERFGARPGRNPTPTQGAGGVEATARWYDAPMRYAEVAAWYAERLATDGWQEEPGHDAIRVFRRADTLLWLADGEDATIWLRSFAGVVPMPRGGTEAEAARPAFTVLTYRTAGVQPLGSGWLGKI